MSTDLLPAWRNIERAIVEEKRWTYGDLITWDEVHELLRLPKPGPSARADQYQDWQLARLKQVDLLRDQMLTEHKMLLHTEIGNGLRIVPPAEQTAVANSRGRAAMAKALRDMRDALVHVNHAQMTSEQIRENTDAQVRFAARVQALRSIDRGELVRLTPPNGDKKPKEES